MRQDETIASSRFWPKIDFSEEKCHGRNAQNISEPLDFKIFRGGGGMQNLPRLVLKSGYGPEMIKLFLRNEVELNKESRKIQKNLAKGNNL